ncbi:ribonuclease P protein component [Deltaproteobacteria bacterium TL4]
MYESPCFAFPKRVRLKRQKEIETVFKAGQYRRLGLIGVKYYPTELGYSRFLISVKKKVGNAPFRNRIKRIMREAIRLQLPELEGSFDICFFFTQKPQYSIQTSYFFHRVRDLFTELNEQNRDGKG